MVPGMYWVLSEVHVLPVLIKCRVFLVSHACHSKSLSLVIHILVCISLLQMFIEGMEVFLDLSVKEFPSWLI